MPAHQLTSALHHAMAGSSFTLSERAGLTLHGLCPQCQPNPAQQQARSGSAEPQSPSTKTPSVYLGLGQENYGGGV